MNDHAAIPNLEFIRQLIQEVRKPEAYDMYTLRMISGTGVGTDNLSTKQGDD